MYTIRCVTFWYILFSIVFLLFFQRKKWKQSTREKKSVKMPPNVQTQTVNEIASTSFADVKLVQEKKKSTVKPRHEQIVWRNVVLMAYLHLAALYGVYLCFTSAKWKTSALGKEYSIMRCWKVLTYYVFAFSFMILFKTHIFAAAFALYIISGLGITAGAHRLWSHKSYKAKWPLRVLLGLFNTMAFENDIYEWWVLCYDYTTIVLWSVVNNK